jgi:hypothetical protein
MKVIYSVLIVMATVFGFASEAEARGAHGHGHAHAHTYASQWVPGYTNHHNRWVHGHYKRVPACHPAHHGHRGPVVVAPQPGVSISYGVAVRANGRARTGFRLFFRI